MDSNESLADGSGAEAPSPEPKTPTSQPNRPHWFQPGNTLAQRHGASPRWVRAASLMPAEAQEALAERVSVIVEALGGRDALSPIAVGLVERHARLEMVDDYLFENLRQYGVLTPKGHRRAALSAWLQVVDRLSRSAVTLGLERRQKILNPIDRIREAVAEANKK